MKYITVIFSLLFLGPSCGRSGVESNAFCGNHQVLQTGINDGFLAIHFTDEKTGFVSGYSGTIYKTTDSAKTWTPVNSPVTLPVRGLYFTDALTGYAVGGMNSCSGTGCNVPGGFILKTTDGGNNWTKVFTTSDKIELSSVVFVNASTGYSAGDNVIAKTTDAGLTWTEYKINNLGGKMMQVRFADPMHGYIACLYDKFIRTSDGGQSWQVSSTGFNTGYYSISIAEGILYMSGQGKMIRSENNGQSWTSLSNSPYDIFDLHFTTKKTGYAVGRGNYSGGDWGYAYGSLYCTNDGGNTWNGTAELAGTRFIQAVSYPTPSTGYAISLNSIVKITQ